MISSLCNLCVLCVFVVPFTHGIHNHRGTENAGCTEKSQIRILTVTSRTTLQHSPALNLISRLQIDSLGQFLSGFVFRPPFHVVNLFNRPHEPFRRTVTLQTPLHLQWRRLIENRHLVDAPVTRRTTNAFFHVNTVIEVSVIRQIVHAFPLDRFVRFETRAHGFEIRTIGPDLFVAIHARRGRRQSRGRGRFDGRVTVAAIDAVVTDVMFMTELNGLLNLNPLAGVPRGTIQLNRHPQQSNDYKNGAINRDFRQRVGAVMEDLWHLRVIDIGS